MLVRGQNLHMWFNSFIEICMSDQILHIHYSGYHNINSSDRAREAQTRLADNNAAFIQSQSTLSSPQNRSIHLLAFTEIRLRQVFPCSDLKPFLYSSPQIDFTLTVIKGDEFNSISGRNVILVMLFCLGQVFVDRYSVDK